MNEREDEVIYVNIMYSFIERFLSQADYQCDNDISQQVGLQVLFYEC